MPPSVRRTTSKSKTEKRKPIKMYVVCVLWHWTPPIDVAQQAIEQLQQYFKDNETSDAYVALVDVDGNAKARGILRGFAFLLIVDLNGFRSYNPSCPKPNNLGRVYTFSPWTWRTRRLHMRTMFHRLSREREETPVLGRQRSQKY